MKQNKEYRVLMNVESTVDNSRKISGYAAVFNNASEDLGFIETILPEAITQDTINNSDVLALIDHDNTKVLARSKYGSGNLKLSVDDKGLYFEFDALEDVNGQSALEQVKAGIITQCSFAFTVAEGGDTWSYNQETDTYYRTLTRIEKLYDISLVYTPAYSETHVEASKRSLQEFKDSLKSSLSQDIQNTIQEVRKENIMQERALNEATEASIDYDKVYSDLQAYWDELKSQIK